MAKLENEEVSVFYKIGKAVDFIHDKVNRKANIGLVLGTGLGAFGERLTDAKEIDYSSIPFFPVSTVSGHKGKLIFGKIHDKNVVLLSGRFHLYEGYTAQELAFPIRVLAALGVRILLISNMAGGLLSNMLKGDLYMISDHINLMHGNPLIGPNDVRLGPRFPDMKNAYDTRLLALGESVAKELKYAIGQTVYAAMSGPSLETPAEYNMLHILGAGLVGMSTVPEVIAARHLGMSVFAVSIVSNVCYPINRIKETTLDSVIKVGVKGGRKLADLFEGMIKNL